MSVNSSELPTRLRPGFVYPKRYAPPFGRALSLVTTSLVYTGTYIHTSLSHCVRDTWRLIYS